MKRLYILRHAKSSWDDASLADFDRPLNARGLKAARFMGELLAKKRVLPDIFIASPAKRASHTALIVRESSGSDAPMRNDERIYEASPRGLNSVVLQIPESFDSAMLVGHNPGIEGFIRYLTGEQERMPTAALASISLNIKEWMETGERCGTLDYVLRPKEQMALTEQNAG